MIVKDLIEHLKKMPQDADAMVSSDEEGNAIKDIFDIAYEVVHFDQGGPKKAVVITPYE